MYEFTKIEYPDNIQLKCIYGGTFLNYIDFEKQNYYNDLFDFIFEYNKSIKKSQNTTNKIHEFIVNNKCDSNSLTFNKTNNKIEIDIIINFNNTLTKSFKI